MALDLEEQEQLAALKAWWKENGTLVVAVVLAASVAFAGWTGWNRYKSGQAAEASVLYEALTKAVQAGDDKAVREAGGTLVESYSGTHYAALGALLAARHYFDQGDLKNARAQLQWVIEEAPSDDLRDIARLRLGAVLLDEKVYDEVLALVEAPHGEVYAAQFAALKGDVLVAKGEREQAKAAYRQALEKAGQGERAFAESVRMRLEGLGG